LIPGVRMVVVGRQGAGKGTQCVRLSRHYVVPHISTGDILRAAVREGTEFGKKATALMERSASRTSTGRVEGPMRGSSYRRELQTSGSLRDVSSTP